MNEMHVLLSATRFLHRWWQGEDIFLSSCNDCYFFISALFPPNYPLSSVKLSMLPWISRISRTLKLIPPASESGFRSCTRFLARSPQCNAHYQSYHYDLRRFSSLTSLFLRFDAIVATKKRMGERGTGGGEGQKENRLARDLLVISAHQFPWHALSSSQPDALHVLDRFHSPFQLLQLLSYHDVGSKLISGSLTHARSNEQNSRLSFVHLGNSVSGSIDYLLGVVGG